MEEGYRLYNESALSKGGKGVFVIDLCKPGHMTSCLTTFQEVNGASIDNWDAIFSEQWKTSDLVDCILSYAATELVKMVTKNDDQAKKMLDQLKSDPKHCRQFLLLVHLYSRTDSSALSMLRRTLLKPSLTAAQVTVGVGAGVSAVTASVLASRDVRVASVVSEHVDFIGEKLSEAIPFVGSHPKLTLAVTAGVTFGGLAYYIRRQQVRSRDRAVSILRNIKVVKPQPVDILQQLLARCFTSYDSHETIRQLCIGISAHQKLDLLSGLVRLLGYEGLAVFGDCFDEVTLLDPVKYPGAIKAFAREICRNDVLNFGRLHFFFPDSRLSLDLSTDRTLKEARFDRHFVRDLTWSRHQLEELAERRFRAAQDALKDGDKAAHGQSKGTSSIANDSTSFADLFKMVRGEDFSSYIAKLSTPRELLIMMTEMFSRIESHPDGGLTAQDMEIAVTRALEQSV